MTPFRIDTHPNDKDRTAVAKIIHQYHKQRKGNKATIIKIILCAIICCLFLYPLNILFTFIEQTTEDELFAFVKSDFYWLIAITVFGFGILAFGMRYHFIKSFNSNFKSLNGRTISYIIDENGLTTTEPLETHWGQWHTIHHIIVANDYLIFTLSNRAIFIPLRDFPTPEAAQTFIQTAQQYHEKGTLNA